MMEAKGKNFNAPIFGFYSHTQYKLGKFEFLSPVLYEPSTIQQWFKKAYH